MSVDEIVAEAMQEVQRNAVPVILRLIKEAKEQNG